MATGQALGPGEGGAATAPAPGTQGLRSGAMPLGTPRMGQPTRPISLASAGGGEKASFGMERYLI